MATKSDRLYGKSPKIERDGDGKPGISRPSEADAENMGIGGDNAEGAQSEMAMNVEQLHSTHDRHQKEMKDMHGRHEGEAKDMHKRHAKEISKHFGKDKEED